MAVANLAAESKAELPVLVSSGLSSSVTPSTSSVTSFTSPKDQLAALLGVSHLMMDGSDGSLCWCYQRYQAYQEAQKTLEQMVSEGTCQARDCPRRI
jgi:hypothetical protein